jgi:2-dehydropantoate 2-reductase
VRNRARIERLGRDAPGVSLTADVSGLRTAALVFLCIKAYDTEAAADALGTLRRPQPTICSLQNGWGNLDILEAKLPGTPLLAGATTLGAYLDDAGSLHASTSGGTQIAPWGATPPARADEAVQVLRAAGLSAEPAVDAREILWRKLVLNAAVNPLTAIVLRPNGALLEEPSLLRLAEGAAVEAAEVGQRLGLLPAPWNPIPALHALLRETRANFSSMAQDLARGRRTEIEAIAGAIVRASERSAAPAPVLRALLALVRVAEGAASP